MSSLAKKGQFDVSVKELNLSDRSLEIRWSDGKVATFHYLWLRDNCPSGFHPSTQERLFNLTTVSPDIYATEGKFDQTTLSISWSEEAHKSTYQLQWLYKNAYSSDFKKPDTSVIVPWGTEILNEMHEVEYNDLMQDDLALFNWLKEVQKSGISYVRNVPCTDEGVTDVANRISFLRQTNFGTVFDVQSKPNPIKQRLYLRSSTSAHRFDQSGNATGISIPALSDE